MHRLYEILSDFRLKVQAWSFFVFRTFHAFLNGSNGSYTNTDDHQLLQPSFIIYRFLIFATQITVTITLLPKKYQPQALRIAAFCLLIVNLQFFSYLLIALHIHSIATNFTFSAFIKLIMLSSFAYFLSTYQPYVDLVDSLFELYHLSVDILIHLLKNTCSKLLRDLHTYKDSLNGSHGEYTNTDDLDNAARRYYRNLPFQRAHNPPNPERRQRNIDRHIAQQNQPENEQPPPNDNHPPGEDVVDEQLDDEPQELEVDTVAIFLRLDLSGVQLLLYNFVTIITWIFAHLELFGLLPNGAMNSIYLLLRNIHNACYNGDAILPSMHNLMNTPHSVSNIRVVPLCFYEHDTLTSAHSVPYYRLGYTHYFQTDISLEMLDTLRLKHPGVRSANFSASTFQRTLAVDFPDYPHDLRLNTSIYYDQVCIREETVKNRVCARRENVTY